MSVGNLTRFEAVEYRWVSDGVKSVSGILESRSARDCINNLLLEESYSSKSNDGSVIAIHNSGGVGAESNL